MWNLEAKRVREERCLFKKRSDLYFVGFFIILSSRGILRWSFEI